MTTVSATSDDRPTARVVLMAKAPQPGEVKTRLIGGRLSAEQAAAVSRAMLVCIANRLHDRFAADLVLALSPDEAVDEIGVAAWSRGLPPIAKIIRQGPGDLGERMRRVWSDSPNMRSDKMLPTAFFGIDSPDVPDEALEELDRILHDPLRDHIGEIILGPTYDGGYWTIAGHCFIPAILDGIEWGSDRVFDQTCRQAESLNLTVRTLATWHDVDEPGDLEALVERIRPSVNHHLVRLREEIISLL